MAGSGYDPGDETKSERRRNKSSRLSVLYGKDITFFTSSSSLLILCHNICSSLSMVLASVFTLADKKVSSR